MNQIQIFNNPEFGSIRTVEINNEPWFVGKDVAGILGYQNGSRDINAHVDDSDRLKYQISTAGQMREQTIINESGLYSLILSSKLPRAKEFKHWVTAEVLPAIRKTGSYNLPNFSNPAEAARAWADEYEKRQLAESQVSVLRTENAIQSQQIAELKPAKEYVDTILASKDTVTTTQIAADYGMSARKLNEILHEARLIRNVGGQWVLYSDFMQKGFTKSETITVPNVKTGGTKVVMHTKWTQKGRLKIHEILTKRGIKANMDKDVA